MDNQIEEVKNRTDIVSFISEYLSLTKKGKNYWANCPFHSEKTPSFAVSQERQIFKCFGCGEGGNVFSFYQKMEGVSFSQAFQVLAKRAGVTLDSKKVSEEEEKKDRLYQINQKASDFYHYVLTKHQAGTAARDYLKDRGVNQNSITQFTLGFAPNDWETLTRYLLKKGYSNQDLLTSGLSLPSSRGKGLYDRFRNRIIFPVFDLNGRIVGFSGRIFSPPASGGEPKYLNSPDTAVFNKSLSLYGLFQGKTDLKKENLAVLVEGNLDVISSHQVGVRNVFAPLGTALTESQLSLIKRFTDRIAFCFDTDLAGINATQKSFEIAEKLDFNIKIVTLPVGKDPDECIQKDPSLWQKALRNPEDFYEYYLSTLLKRFDPNSAEGKKRIISELLPYLNKIRNEVTLADYKEKTALALDLEKGLINRLLSRSRSSSFVPPLPSPVVKIKPRQEILEEYLLALLVQSGLPAQWAGSNLDLGRIEFFNQNLAEIFHYWLRFLKKEKKFDPNSFASKLPENLLETYDKLTLMEVGSDILEEPSVCEKEIKRVLRELKEISIRQKLQKLSVEINQAEITKNNQKLVELRDNFSEISKQLSGIEVSSK